MFYIQKNRLKELKINIFFLILNQNLILSRNALNKFFHEDGTRPSDTDCNFFQESNIKYREGNRMVSERRKLR